MLPKTYHIQYISALLGLTHYLGSPLCTCILFNQPLEPSGSLLACIDMRIISAISQGEVITEEFGKITKIGTFLIC
jgi:hypothetical protein